MGLFTNPVVLNDGTANRTFIFRSQINDSKSVAGEWIEPAADLDAESKLTIKHAVTGNIHRDLMSGRENVLMPDGVTLSPITVNFNVVFTKGVTEVQMTKRIKLHIDAISKPDFVKNFMNGLI